MKKINFIQHLNLLLVFSLFLSSNVVLGHQVHQDPPKSIRTVVIDAGHGGKDEGGMGKNSMEKDITLAIAQKLGRKIESRFVDVEVVYTRTSDVFMPLDKRAQIANEAKGDVFISIHCNALRQKKIYGTEVYVVGEVPTNQLSEVVKRENEVVRLEDNYSNKYDALKPSVTGYETESMDLARKIERELGAAGRKTLGIKKEPFVVLRMTYMPGVLVESGFLTNSKEEDFLLSNNGQEQVADAIAKAFESYKTERDVQVASTQRIHIPRTVYSPALRPIQSVITRTDLPKTEVTDELREELLKDANYSPETDLQLSRRVEYKVELGATPNVLNTSQSPWKEVRNLETAWDGEIYRHCAVGYLDYDAAIKGMIYWRKHGFPNAYLVTFKNGVRLRQ